MTKVMNFILAILFIGFITACGGGRQEVQTLEEATDSASIVMDTVAAVVEDSIEAVTDSVEVAVDSVKTEE